MACLIYLLSIAVIMIHAYDAYISGYLARGSIVVTERLEFILMGGNFFPFKVMDAADLSGYAIGIPPAHRTHVAA